MIFFFGWNTYLLKSFSLEELGLPSGYPGSRIEFRQRYFHLFFIPCFPIGRYWSLRQDGKSYHISAELEQALHPIRPGGKHRLWAWSAPILAIAFYFMFSINENMEQRAYKNRTEKNMAMLTAFFADKSKTAPLEQKLETINTLTDSVLAMKVPEKRHLDTTESNLLIHYLEAKASQDSLTGYTKENTFVVNKLLTTTDRNELISEQYRTALKEGSWKGYNDTSSVFPEMRRLGQYEYILVLREYNRLEPLYKEGGYTSGYSLVRGTIVSIKTGEIKKEFKLFASNSDEVSNFQFTRNSTVTAGEWTRTLDNDLNQNILKEAHQYVFGQPMY